MEIKICGIRREEDIEIINKYKPEYIGFIFAPYRRQVTPETAWHLSERLNRDTKTVGVFVNASIGDIKNIAEDVLLDVVQLHGDEDAEYIKTLRNSLDTPCEIWKAVRVKDGVIPDIRGADKILLDKYDAVFYGGTGETFDWSSAGTLKTNKPIVLAGGLNCDNVKKGIELFRPVCVDVSSSVETDGIKDEEKIRDFINTVREMRL